ncbi:triacylglycerol lipase [Zea mays]|uniref:Lipase n=1 Tax=Zea mays TaxID=4577 RepID=A0A804PVU3_MAIZE|nr:triacylglycerol lipase [Zea mays]
MAQKDLYLPFLALSIIACCLMNLQTVLSSSSRMRNSTDDISDDKCPPQPHPLGMCRSRVAAYGYPCEEYHVTTEDGYILSLKRIPYGLSGATEMTRTPVLLFHGLLVDGFCWVLSTPKQSLGFILADGGFDVWIANSRGTESSRRHTTLSPQDPAFWDWTWDQLADYDLPAVLEFVYNRTGGMKVHYVGHSLGTLIILAAFSENRLTDIVRSAALLCPIAYLNSMESRLILLATRIFLAETIHMLGYHEFNPVGPVAKEVLGKVCVDPEVDCYDLFSAVAGPDCCLNTSTTCIFLQHGPQSSSIKNMIHMSQLVRKETIRKYDYGSEKENTKRYNQTRPPTYNLSSIPSHVPLFLTHGGQDFLGDVADTRHLLRTLLSQHDSDDIEVLYMPDYAHGDFIMGYNAPQLIYKPMVEFFKRH